MTFKDLNIAEPILRAVREKGYKNPTKIQEQAIPVALRGFDLLGIAQTGTGKTAAFAIPILQQLWQERKLDTVSEVPGTLSIKIRQNKQRPEIKALILTPTRELAAQIEDCFADYGKYTGLKHAVIFGGVGQTPQIDRLRKGIDILIATPGRLIDLMNQGFISLDAVRHFVLDEADRMLDMGFIHDIKRLLPKLPRQKQTLFFSATMPAAIATLSSSILHNPRKVEVAPVASVVDTIEQGIYFVERAQKSSLLISLLQKATDKSVLVFSRTKHGADKLARILGKAGIQSQAIHGNKTQGARERALSDFKSGRIRVMIATDIAARGIDIDRLEMVINYDLPDVAETYVHRIGRTGRAGNQGTALTFCSQEEQEMLREIQKLTGKKLTALSIPA